MKNKIFLVSIIILILFACIQITVAEGIIINPTETKYLNVSGELINLSKFYDDKYYDYRKSENENYQWISNRIGTIEENGTDFIISGNTAMKTNLSIQSKDNVSIKKVKFEEVHYNEYNIHFRHFNITVEIPDGVNITEVNVISKSANGTILSTQPVLIARLNSENEKIFKKCLGDYCYFSPEEYCGVCVSDYCFNHDQCKCMVQDNYYHDDYYSSNDKSDYYFIPIFTR